MPADDPPCQPLEQARLPTGVKILKAPKKAEAAVRAPFVPESKLAAQQKKPAAKPVSKPAPAAKKPAPVKKVCA